MTSPEVPVSVLPTPARQSAIVAVLCTIALVGSFMQMLVIPLQPELPKLLNASLADTAWVVTATLISGAVSNPIAGRLGDMYGKRRVLLVLLLLLIAGSVIAGLSMTLWGVIVGRVLQGLSLGAVPLGISIMRDWVTPRRLSTGASIVSAAGGAGGALGLPLSGFVAETWGLHAVFWLAALLGVLGMVLTLAVIPATGPRTAGRFDLVGALGLAAGTSGLLIALSRGVEWGMGSPATIAVGGVSLLLMAGWCWYELRRKDALIDLRMATRPTVFVTNIASIMIGLASFTGLIMFPQQLSTPPPAGLGLSTATSGALIMSAGITMVLFSPLAGRLGLRVGPRPVLAIGASALVVAFAFSFFFHDEGWHFLVAQALIGVGSGVSFAAIPVIIMAAVPVSSTGAANGLNSLMRSVGTSVASAGIGAILAFTAMDVGGVSLPSADGFQIVTLLVLGIAVVGLVLVFLIPRAEPSRPGG